jgi:disulfide bond formation protein DsbB
VTARHTVLLLAALSATALAIALVSLYAIHYPPCELCILQRIAHGAIIGAAFTLRANRPLKTLVSQTAFIIAAFGLSLFHVGVENHLWEGTRACTGEETRTGMSIADLTAQILSAPAVRCDDVRWSFLGLSMAVWDAILTGMMLAYAGFTLSRKR